MADPKVKCVVANWNEGTIACTAGTPEDVKQAQEALIASEREVLKKDQYSTDPMHIRFSKMCTFKPAGKAQIAVGNRKTTPDEKAACLKKQEQHPEGMKKDSCDTTVLLQEQDKFVVECDGGKK